jgi:hypothetical protein
MVFVAMVVGAVVFVGADGVGGDVFFLLILLLVAMLAADGRPRRVHVDVENVNEKEEEEEEDGCCCCCWVKGAADNTIVGPVSATTLKG